MNPNRKLWSEDEGVVDDGVAVANVGENVQVEDMEKVVERIVKRGVLLMSNCLHCGRQWRAVVPWAEICGFYLGQEVPNTKAVRAGIVWPTPCRCQKLSTLVLNWDDVEKWTRAGVRTGCVSPKIFTAAARP